MRTFTLVFCVLLGSTCYLTSQNTPVADSLSPANPQWDILHKPIEISASSLSTTNVRSVLAISILDKSRLQNGTQQLSMYEVLGAVPGVFAMNPDNFTQDLRISIRGFGARAAFGIRGIRVFTDGLPEGTPDGQVDVDNLDMGVLSKMEVVRGAASGIYGNASGGVIYLQTETPTTQKPLLEAQIAAGGYGFQRYQLKIGQKLGKFTYFATGSHVKTRGYRAWSAMSNSILNGKAIYQPTANCTLSLLLNVGNSPKAQDPGALTSQQMAENPRQAGANNLLFETGETVAQNRIGLTYAQKIGAHHQVDVRVFRTDRQLKNRLPILANGYGNLSRHYQGAFLSYQFQGKLGALPYRLKTGLELAAQKDDRSRSAYILEQVNNVSAYVPDVVVLNQQERFRSRGIYLLQEFYPAKKWLCSFGMRYDQLNLKVQDRYLNDADQSGTRHFKKFNPILGLNYAFDTKASLYANYASSFETPTLNELSNNPDASGGFNPDLNPQTARSVEIGVKGYVPGLPAARALYIDLALFQINTRQDIVPYQLSGQTGRTIYRNAGATLRKGVEIGVNYVAFSGLTLHYTQTFSYFKYQQYEVYGTQYEGNIQPGVPKVNTQLELRYFHQSGVYFIAQARQQQKVYANDANTSSSDGYFLLNLRAGYRITAKHFKVEPYLGVNNLLNAQYVANVQINAANGRYFEPAAPRFVWFGIKLCL